MILYLSQGLSAGVDMVLSFTKPIQLGIIFLQTLHLCLATLSIWLAGTLPMQSLLAAENVARPGDVRTRLTGKYIVV
jgi:ABC-type uncharacterized transport system permease subunit